MNMATDIYNKDFTLRLVLKERLRGTRKWPNGLHVQTWQIGNLRTTTKFTTTTCINRERTGASNSVSAGNNELKKQSRSTTTEMRTVRYGFF